MKKIGIENRVKELGDGKAPFVMIDLIIDGETINTGTEPISSFSFWEDIEEAAQKALYQIKNKNTRFSFDFSLKTKEERNSEFIYHLKKKYPNVNVENILEAFEESIGRIKPFGPDDNHPNPEMKSRLDSDLFKDILISVVDKLHTK